MISEAELLKLMADLESDRVERTITFEPASVTVSAAKSKHF